MRRALLFAPGFALIAWYGAVGCGDSTPSKASSDGTGGAGGLSSIDVGSGGAIDCNYSLDRPVPSNLQDFADGKKPLVSCGTQNIEPLPCGVCGVGEPCQTNHERGCCGAAPTPGPLDGPLDSWLCACVSGRWDCWVLALGGSICLCGDGGPEAGSNPFPDGG